MIRDVQKKMDIASGENRRIDMTPLNEIFESMISGIKHPNSPRWYIQIPYAVGMIYAYLQLAAIIAAMVVGGCATVGLIALSIVALIMRALGLDMPEFMENLIR